MWAYPDQHSDSLPGGSAADLIRRPMGRMLRQLSPWHWLRTWLTRATAAEELYQLDDRSLADLGIARGDFPAILHGSYRRGD